MKLVYKIIHYAAQPAYGSSTTSSETVGIRKTGTYFLDLYNSKKGLPCKATGVN